MPLSRRTVLQGLAGATAAAATAGLPALAHAADAGDRGFLFLFMDGGLDPTWFDPKTGARGASSAGVELDPGTVVCGTDALGWCGGGARSAMDRFFARHGDRSALLRGLRAEAWDHGVARRAALTGSLSRDAADVPSLIGAQSLHRLRTPVVVFDGPSYPGEYSDLVTRVPGLRFEDALSEAVGLFADGNARAVTLSVPGPWDAHDSLAGVDGALDRLFSGLDATATALSRATGRASSSLLDEVTVVVLGEMGRSPQRNYKGGRDHWLTTSALLLGGGVVGGVAVGATDDNVHGLPIDLESGRPVSHGTIPRFAHLAAGLLAHAGLEPARHLPGIKPLSALFQTNDAASPTKRQQGLA